MAFKPEDVMPDAANFAEINGVNIRKGSFAALLANAEILNAPNASLPEKLAAKAAFSEILPNMVAIGLHKHLSWKNPELQSLMEQTAQQENFTR